MSQRVTVKKQACHNRVTSVSQRVTVEKQWIRRAPFAWSNYSAYTAAAGWRSRCAQLWLLCLHCCRRGDGLGAPCCAYSAHGAAAGAWSARNGCRGLTSCPPPRTPPPRRLDGEVQLRGVLLRFAQRLVFFFLLSPYPKAASHNAGTSQSPTKKRTSRQMDFFVHMKGGPRTSTPAKTKYEDFQRPLEPPRTMLKD